MKIVALIDADGLIHRAEWKRTLPEAEQHCDEEMEDIITGSFCDKYLTAVKGDDNFRKEIYPDYKGHRTRSQETQDRLDHLVDYVVDKWGAFRAHGQEADDLVVQWREKVLAKGNLPIICSNDKDLLTVPGTHYRTKERCLYYQDHDGAESFFNLQLIMGDPTDKIPGIPGLGPVKASKLLEGVPISQQRQLVLDLYKQHIGAGWEGYLQLQGDLLYIRRCEGEGFLL